MDCDPTTDGEIQKDTDYYWRRYAAACTTWNIHGDFSAYLSVLPYLPNSYLALSIFDETTVTLPVIGYPLIVNR